MYPSTHFSHNTVVIVSIVFDEMNKVCRGHMLSKS